MGNRRQARVQAMKGMYTTLVTPQLSLEDAVEQAGGIDDADDQDGETARDPDAELLDALVAGAGLDQARELLQGQLDTPVEQLSNVEHAILLLGTVELLCCPATPRPIVLNEWVAVAKEYGGADTYKMVNAVLDGVAIPKAADSG